MWTRGFATLLALIPLALAQQSEWGQCKTKSYIHQFWNEILKLIVKVVVLDGLAPPVSTRHSLCIVPTDE